MPDIKIDGKTLKQSDTKPMFQLIEPVFQRGLALCLTHGAHKYFPDSWKLVPVEEYHGALSRHMNAHLLGETFDKDTGLLHLDHVAADLMFIHWFASVTPQIRKVYEANISRLTYIPTKEAFNEVKNVRSNGSYCSTTNRGPELRS